MITIDHTAYPHIIDLIVSDPGALLAFRNTSLAFRIRAQSTLLRHVVVVVAGTEAGEIELRHPIPPFRPLSECFLLRELGSNIVSGDGSVLLNDACPYTRIIDVCCVRPERFDNLTASFPNVEIVRRERPIPVPLGGHTWVTFIEPTHRRYHTNREDIDDYLPGDVREDKTYQPSESGESSDSDMDIELSEDDDDNDYDFDLGYRTGEPDANSAPLLWRPTRELEMWNIQDVQVAVPNHVKRVVVRVGLNLGSTFLQHSQFSIYPENATLDVLDQLVIVLEPWGTTRTDDPDYVCIGFDGYNFVGKRGGSYPGHWKYYRHRDWSPCGGTYRHGILTKTVDMVFRVIARCGTMVTFVGVDELQGGHLRLNKRLRGQALVDAFHKALVKDLPRGLFGQRQHARFRRQTFPRGLRQWGEEARTANWLDLFPRHWRFLTREEWRPSLSPEALCIEAGPIYSSPPGRCEDVPEDVHHSGHCERERLGQKADERDPEWRV